MLYKPVFLTRGCFRTKCFAEMYLRTAFKDYYDYLARNPDPTSRAVYNRSAITVPAPALGCRNSSWPGEYGLMVQEWELRGPGLKFYQRKLLFCGRIFNLISKNTVSSFDAVDWCLLTPSNYLTVPLLDPKLLLNKRYYGSYERSPKTWLKRATANTEPLASVLPDLRLVAIHRRLDAPVVVWGSADNARHADRRIPVLAELGFPAVFPAEQVFQVLEQFISNTIQTTADSVPPAKVEDKQRLVQRGFDLKSSFRNTHGKRSS